MMDFIAIGLIAIPILTLLAGYYLGRQEKKAQAEEFQNGVAPITPVAERDDDYIMNSDGQPNL